MCGDGQVCADSEACDDGDTLVCGACNASCSGAGQATNCCVTANAGNIVPNPGFNSSSLASWTSANAQITMTHSSLDTFSCSSSGSMLVTNSAPSGLNSGVYQCLPVGPGITYNVGGRVRVQSGGAQGQSFLAFYFLNGAGCTGSFIGPMTQFSATGPVDTWQYLHAENITSPAGAVSMQVYAQVIKNLPDAGSVQAYYDMLYATPPPGNFDGSVDTQVSSGTTLCHGCDVCQVLTGPGIQNRSKSTAGVTRRWLTAVPSSSWSATLSSFVIKPATA